MVRACVVPLGYIVIIESIRCDIPMIIEQSSSNPVELKTRLCQIVLENKISSIEKLSEIAETEEEEAKLALQELVSEGSLSGSFTEDGSRFFLSDIKVSNAPTLGPVDLGPEIEIQNSRLAKTVLISGIVMMAVGYLLRGLIAMGEIMGNVGFAVILIGLAVLIVGWMMFSKMNPPSHVRP
jgi:hypothetical protein